MSTGARGKNLVRICFGLSCVGTTRNGRGSGGTTSSVANCRNRSHLFVLTYHYSVESQIVLCHNLIMDKATIKAKPPAAVRKHEGALQQLGMELDTYLKAVRVSENLTLLIRESGAYDDYLQGRDGNERIAA